MAQNESECHQPFRLCDHFDYLRCKDEVKNVSRIGVFLADLRCAAL